MTIFHFPPLGLPEHEYLAMLTAGDETGWWDENGQPAPWPEDFPDGWQPSTWAPTPLQPGEPPF
jgi:hypothetical protein